MLERFSDAALEVLQLAKEECQKLKGQEIGTDHLLIALASDPASLSAQALLSMGLNKEAIVKEVQKLLESTLAGRAQLAAEPSPSEALREPIFSDKANDALYLARDHCRYLGQDEVEPEHLLLAIVELSDDSAVKLLEELGANLAFLKRQIMYLMAEFATLNQIAPSAQAALTRGLTELIADNLEAHDMLARLALRSETKLPQLAERIEIVHMVLVGYLPEFLTTQVAFQRYLLEESLRLLAHRSGSLDQELTATIVSNSAQHLRFEVRSTIENLWTNEYRLFDQMLDEAEHDLIGSVLEDLWWAQSEEVALNQLFDSALDDHRRKQVLSLQKRRIELNQRINKLHGRLKETIRQCFLKRTVPA